MTPRAAYLPTLRNMMPHCAPDQTELRCSLLMLRDRATERKAHCSSAAYGALDDIDRLASTYAYAPMGTTALAALQYGLVRMMLAASTLETFGRGMERDD